MSTAKNSQRLMIGYSDDENVGGTLEFNDTDSVYVDLRQLKVGDGDLTVELHIFLHEEGRLKLEASIIDPGSFDNNLAPCSKVLHKWDVMIDEEGNVRELNEEEE